MKVDTDKLFLTPTFDNINGWEIYTLNEDGTRKDITVQELYDSSGETIYLSRILDKQMEKDGYTILELDGSAWQESVFLNDQLLYTVDPSLDKRIGHVTFSNVYEGLSKQGEYIRLSLPSGYSSKTLTIAVAFNVSTNYRGLPMVRLSSENIQTQMLVSDANSLAIPATAYMVIAVLLIGLFFYNWYHGQRSYSLLLLMLTALIQSLRVLLNYEFYFSSHFSLSFLPVEYLVPLSFAMPLLYLLSQMKRWKKWYAPFILGPLGLSLIFHFFSRFPIMSFITTYQYDALLYLALVAFIVFAILEWRDKNIVYRLFLPAMLTSIVVFILVGFGLIITVNDNTSFVSILLSPIKMINQSLEFYSSVLLILAGAVSCIVTVKKSADIQSELSVLSLKNELITENLQNIEDSSTEIATIRHDMLRHLHTMLDLSHAGNNDRLNNYLEELTKKTEDIPPVKICLHPIVNALISRALTKAKKDNIPMNLNIDVPADINISDNDLCTLIMNMLDNAISAAALLHDDQKRSVELTIHIRGRYLFVETINSYYGSIIQDKDTGLLQSKKGHGHGYGMKAMNEVAKKYSSKLQIMLEQDVITVRTALLIPEG